MYVQRSLNVNSSCFVCSWSLPVSLCGISHEVNKDVRHLPRRIVVPTLSIDVTLNPYPPYMFSFDPDQHTTPPKVYIIHTDTGVFTILNIFEIHVYFSDIILGTETSTCSCHSVIFVIITVNFTNKPAVFHITDSIILL